MPAFVKRLAPCLVLAVVTLAAYVPALHGGFIWDDIGYVQKNDNLRDLDGLFRSWFEPLSLPQYYPMVWTTFWVEYQLWGLHTFGYHLVNVLLHVVAALLLWRVLRRLEVPAAWIAAAVFALHPVAAESVAWISERKNTLSAVFYLAAVHAYLGFADRRSRAEGGGSGSGALPYAASLVLFACALLSKSATATLPAVLLVVAWWKRGRITRGELTPLVPFFLLAIVCGLITVYIETAHVGAQGADWEHTPAERVLLAGRVAWFYAAKVVWPHPLVFIYPRWEIDAQSWSQALFPAGVLVVLAGLLLLRRRIGRGPLAAVLIFGGTLAPVLGFFDVYMMRFTYVADHWLYHASMVLIVAIVAGTARLSGGLPRPVTAVLVAGLLAVLGTLTWRQARLYDSAETIWRDVIAKNPTAWIAHNNLGRVLLERGESELAATHFDQVLRLKPDHGRALYNLGLLSKRDGDDAAAERHFRAAIRAEPRFPRPYSELGVLLGQKGSWDEAIARLEQALVLKPDFAIAKHNLGVIHKQLAPLRARQDRHGEAVGHYRAALTLGPFHPETARGLAWLLATSPDPGLRDAEEARTWARRCVDATQERDAESLAVLAAALAAAGRFDAAIAWQEKAVAVAALGRRLELRRQLQRYEAGEPYREP